MSGLQRPARRWGRLSLGVVAASGAALIASGGSAIPPTSAAVAAGPVVVAAGDISCSSSNPAFGGTDPAVCQQAATADEVVAMHPEYVLTLGDEQYVEGARQGQQPTVQQYQQGYGRTWGQIPARVPGVAVHTVPGDHDYGNVSECPTCSGVEPATSYFAYFGPSGQHAVPSEVTGSSNDWYSYDIDAGGGTWHVAALDTVCQAVGGCGPGSPEETWFRDDLAAHQGDCILVQEHDPRWASGDGGDESNLWALWDDAVKYHVTAVLAGHDHLYERFLPMDGDGQPSPGGTAEFIVGTGGKSLESYADQAVPPPAALAAQDDRHFGVLELTLHEASLDFAFRSTTGQTIDGGSLPCTSTPPVVTAIHPNSGPLAGGTPVDLRGDGFGPGDVVQFGSATASSLTVTSPRRMVAVAPPGPRQRGKVFVTVTSPSGTSEVSVHAVYTYRRGPSDGSTTRQAGSPDACRPAGWSWVSRSGGAPSPWGCMTEGLATFVHRTFAAGPGPWHDLVERLAARPAD